MSTLFDLHRDWGYIALAANGLVGLYALAAWRWRRLRGRPVWIATLVAELAMLGQILLGVILVVGDDTYAAAVPRFHMFYGFIAFVTVGVLYQYRDSMRGNGRRELLYGLGGLFIMGLAIRAILQVE